MSSAVEVLQRREQVKRLMLMGRKYWQIATDLGVSTATSKRDISAVKDEIASQIKTEPSTVLSMLVAEFDNALKELWIQYRNPENEKLKANILMKIGSMVSMKAETFHRFGFAGLPENQVNIQINSLVSEVKKVMKFGKWKSESAAAG